MKTDFLRRLFASSMICGAVFGSWASVAHAQAPPGDLAEVVVTGSRIPTLNLTSVAPVTTVTSADVKASGASKIEDILNSLPQVAASQGSHYSNGSNGTASVNLRGLGAERTVVLIDGRRLQAGNPLSIGAVAADLNFIPSSLVQRIDVLTGGASAVYGADAVAGVVNFIMQKDFEGVRLNAGYSFYQHRQHSRALADIIRAARATAAIPDNFIVPGNAVDGEGAEVTLTMGVNSPDGRGNITAYATYVSINPVVASQRDYTACTLNSGSSIAAAGCSGSGTAYPARIAGFVVDPSGPGNTFRPRNPATDVYNFAPTNYMQRPDLRYGLGAFAHYKIHEMAEVYADLMFMDDTSTLQIAPAGVFVGFGPGPGGAYQINCNNPLMSAQQQSLLCGAAAGSPTLVNVAVARRNVEGGPRQSEYRHTAYRYVIGSKGDLGSDWHYDAFLQYGVTDVARVQTGSFLTSRINNALRAERNSAGQIVCSSVITGSDPSCVPYNIFQLGVVTTAQLDYLQSPAFLSGAVTERVANFNLVGLAPDAIKSPWATSRVGLSLGSEYRREHLSVSPDFVESTGQANASGAVASVSGSYDVYEIFGEARVPLVEDAPLAKSVTLELAYRFSDYSNAGTTHTYKVAGDWLIVDGLRVRGGYNRAVRAPNVNELFGPRVVAQVGSQDPCAGLAANDPLVQRCASLFRLTTAQVLGLEPDPTRRYNGLTGGNTNLRPETADTYTLGLVWQPTFVPGLNVSVDYFDIDVRKYISTIGADTIIVGCVNQTRPQYCSLVHRDEIGSIRSPNGYVEATLFNTGGLHTSGVDFSVGYRSDLDAHGLSNAGSVSASFVGTWLDKLETTPQAGDSPIDCAGLYGALCSSLGGSPAPNPEWRHKMRLTWQTPFTAGDWLSGLGISAQWRYLSAVDLDTTSSQLALGGSRAGGPGGPATDLKLGARSYLDLLATFTVKERFELRVGVNNVLDRDPPLTGSANCPNGPCSQQNIWPQVYDGLGRYLFVGLTADF